MILFYKKKDILPLFFNPTDHVFVLLLFPGGVHPDIILFGKIYHLYLCPEIVVETAPDTPTVKSPLENQA